MTKTKSILMAGAMLSGVLLAGSAQATIVISNTGNNTAWNVGSSGSTVAASTVTNPVWFANTATSSWISTSTSGNAAPGYYTYSTSFTAASTDTLNFRFAVDDSVSSIVLNGVTVFAGPAVAAGNYYGWTNFSISGLLNGANSLAFNTVNQDVNGNPPVSNPAGFRFEASAVPEPATWGMMILGFGLMGTALRRRKQIEGALKIA